MLEYIVRPFQQPNSHGTIIIHSTPKESAETAILTWSGEGDLPDTVFYERGFNTRKHREDYDELNRDTETVRIQGTSDDSGNVYVDVQRANKVYFDKFMSGKGQDAGQAGQAYTVNPRFVTTTPGISTSNAADPDKIKATMKLNNNTTGTGG
jgi:hypothetical protein